MNKTLIISAVFIAFLLSIGIVYIVITDEDTSNTYKIENVEINQWIKPVENARYYGKNYLHSLNNIESNYDDSGIIVSGEVLNSGELSTSQDYLFEIEYKIDGNRIIQRRNKDALNDSNYSDVVLLDFPLAKGKKWTFESKDFYGDKVEFTAQIVELTEDYIEVEYLRNKDYVEKRIFVKNIGIIEFRKEFFYNEEKYISGFNISDEIYNDRGESVDLMVEVEAPLGEVNNELELDRELIEINNNLNENNQYLEESFLESYFENGKTTIDYGEFQEGNEELLNFFIAYQKKWIEYVNKSDNLIFNNLDENSSAYQAILEFDIENILEQFDSIEILDIRKEDELYYIDTSENIVFYIEGQYFEKRMEQTYEIIQKGDGYKLVNFY